MSNLFSVKKQAGVVYRKWKEQCESTFWNLRRKLRTAIRHIFKKSNKTGYSFSVLCVKKRDYVDLVIRQANSLHYFNPAHTFAIYTDDVCEKIIKENIKKFDYPEMIIVKNRFGKAERPWQYSKMEMYMETAKTGGMSIDADMVWHEDPVIPRDYPILFAPARLFKENEAESMIIEKLFGRNEWLDSTHFVTAFVSIPSTFITKKFMDDCQNYLATIRENPLLFIEDPSLREETRRVSEEIALCLALEENYPGKTQPLKIDGNRKNKKMLEPIYYGCENRIIN